MTVTVDYNNLKPIQKVAALLISLGPGTASEILKCLPSEELLEQITVAISTLDKIPPDVLNSTIEEFYQYFTANKYISTGGTQYAQDLLKKAYGSEKASTLMDRLVPLFASNPFQFFNDADPTQMATSFKAENSQLIALVLAYLRPEQSAKVLNELPSGIQAEVAEKIAEMGSLNPEILAEVEKIIEAKFSAVVAQDFSKAGGIRTLANILNRTDRATEKNVLDTLEIRNSRIAEDVREFMFVFEDIVKLDDKSIQRVLRELDSRDIAIALKGTKQDLKDKIFNNLSERAQAMLAEDIEYMGPVRMKDVQKTQGKIVATIRQLETEGEVVIVRDDQEDEFVE